MSKISHIPYLFGQDSLLQDDQGGSGQKKLGSELFI